MKELVKRHLAYVADDGNFQEEMTRYINQINESTTDGEMQKNRQMYLRTIYGRMYFRKMLVKAYIALAVFALTSSVNESKDLKEKKLKNLKGLLLDSTKVLLNLDALPALENVMNNVANGVVSNAPQNVARPNVGRIQFGTILWDNISDKLDESLTKARTSSTGETQNIQFNDIGTIVEEAFAEASSEIRGNTKESWEDIVLAAEAEVDVIVQEGINLFAQANANFTYTMNNNEKLSIHEMIDKAMTYITAAKYALDMVENAKNDALAGKQMRNVKETITNLWARYNNMRQIVDELVSTFTMQTLLEELEVAMGKIQENVLNATKATLLQDIRLKISTANDYSAVAKNILNNAKSSTQGDATSKRKLEILEKRYEDMSARLREHNKQFAKLQTEITPAEGGRRRRVAK
jgi:hypothetical protein